MTKLCELRKGRKLSQAKLGEMIGVGQRTVGRYECGTIKPSPEKAEAIRAIFNLTTDEMWETPYQSHERGKEPAA